MERPAAWRHPLVMSQPNAILTAMKYGLTPRCDRVLDIAYGQNACPGQHRTGFLPMGPFEG